MIRVGFVITANKASWLGGINYLRTLLTAVTQIRLRRHRAGGLRRSPLRSGGTAPAPEGRNARDLGVGPASARLDPPRGEHRPQPERPPYGAVASIATASTSSRTRVRSAVPRRLPDRQLDPGLPARPPARSSSRLVSYVARPAIPPAVRRVGAGDCEQRGGTAGLGHRSTHAAAAKARVLHFVVEPPAETGASSRRADGALRAAGVPVPPSSEPAVGPQEPPRRGRGARVPGAATT